MRVVFNPALGETCHVSANGTTAELHFTATIDQHIGPAKLQLWSDIPANGRRLHEWGEVDFEPVPLLNDHEFSLLSVDEQEQLTRTLTLVIPVSVFASTQRFSFTYRLVHPDRDTEWLGAYGHNGTLVLSRTDSQPVVLGQGWESIDSHSHRLELKTNSVRDLEVARLSHPGDYTAIENSFMRSKNSALVVLVPRLSSNPVVLPPILIFGSTSGSLSFSSHGTIMTTGAGSLYFFACDPAAGAPALFRDFSPSRVRVVSNNRGVLVLASPGEKHPIEVVVLPTASSNLLTHSTLTVRNLSSLLPAGAQLCVFSSLRRHARVFCEPEVSGDSITFAVGQSGGQFVLAPIETLNNAAGEHYQLAVVTPFTPLPIAANRLPTPPPSPRLRPLVHRTESQSPDPSFLSLPAAISNDRAENPSTQLVVRQGASQRRAGPLAAIRHFFIILFIWIARFFRRRSSDMRPRLVSAADEQTPLLAEPVVFTLAQETLPQPLPEAADQALLASPISVHTGAGRTTIVSLNSPFTIPIHLDGQEVEPHVQKIDDDHGLLLVEVSTPTAGRLTIGW